MKKKGLAPFAENQRTYHLFQCGGEIDKELMPEHYVQVDGVGRQPIANLHLPSFLDPSSFSQYSHM
jgi:hypothetical protein